MCFLLYCLLLVNLASLASSETFETTISSLGPIINDEDIRITKLNVSEDSSLRAITYPCQCVNAQCGCCTGKLLSNLNINMRHRACMNMTYDPDDFAVAMKLYFNDRMLYSTKMSGKNPPPVCVPIPRITAIKFCVRLSNVYFIGRNVHACVNVEAQWNKETAFAMNFDCVRMGTDGFSIVKPEEGGGLPHPVTPDTDNIEEYDELLENQSTIQPPKPPKPSKPAKPTKPAKPSKPSKPTKPVGTNTTATIAS